MTQHEPYEPDEPRGWSPLSVALIATLVLLLGAGGAVYGVQAANRHTTPSSTTSPSPLPQVFPTQTTTPPVQETTPPVTSPAADTFALPDVTTGDFKAARAKIRELRLGWQLVFEGADPTDATVRATDPAAGTQVRRGTTVKILVRGAAPLATVPPVVGQPCAQAVRTIVDEGLYPVYDTGREGTVQSQTPAATDPPASHWNDRVHISCG